MSFDQLRRDWRGKHIIAAGNGPSLNGLSTFSDSDAGLFTVNAGLHLLDGYGQRADLLWIQDTRMMTEKSAMVLPYLSGEMTLCAPCTVQLPPIQQTPTIIRFNTLGNEGYSSDPRIGAFTGYTAMFGLFQLIGWVKPAKLTIFGLDMGYGAQDTRAYQTRRGLDVDLHVNDRQIAATRIALQRLREGGVEIDHRSDRSILHASVSAG